MGLSELVSFDRPIKFISPVKYSIKIILLYKREYFIKFTIHAPQDDPQDYKT